MADIKSEKYFCLWKGNNLILEVMWGCEGRQVVGVGGGC